MRNRVDVPSGSGHMELDQWLTRTLRLVLPSEILLGSELFDSGVIHPVFRLSREENHGPTLYGIVSIAWQFKREPAPS